MPLIDQNAPRLFFWTLAATLVLKLFLAFWFPLTGDEAFFYQWGQAPAMGYADHPPMVGWWLAGLSGFSDHIGVARLAPVFLTAVVALGIVDALRRLLPPSYEATAWWMGAIYLVMPWTWMLVLVTTDTPLIFFMSLSAWLFIRAETAQTSKLIWPWFAASGLALGLAFLSKYFAVLLGVAYAVYLLGWRRDRWWALLWIVSAALPSVAVHLYFNAYHGWQNVMFNLFNRHEQAQWNVQTLLVYGLMIVYLFTPWLVYRSVRQPSLGLRQPRALVGVLLAVPLLLLCLVALKRSVGLHWVLGFVPLFLLWAAFARYQSGQLSKLYQWTLWLSVPHLMGVWVLAGSPLHWWANSSQYDKLVFLRHADQVTAQVVADLPPKTQLMTTSYSPAAVLAYHAKQYVPVFGVGRHYARQDDLVVNFADLHGQNIRVFHRSPIDPKEYEPFFNSTKMHSFEIQGTSFYWIEGEGFNYPAYREAVLTDIADQFHRIPDWLPILGNPFCERYGFPECAPVGTPQPNMRK